MATDEDSNRFSSVNDERWKNVYRDYIKRTEASLPSDGFVSMKYYYSLVYIDGDDIPELYIEGTYEAEGDRICTITKNGTVAVCWLNQCFGSYYKEKSGSFCNFNGDMGHYDLDLVPWDTLSYPWENLYQADEILEILS